MFKFFKAHKEGRYLLAGTCLMLLGFALSGFPPFAQLSFYLAIFFLGFFATKNTVTCLCHLKHFDVDLLMILAALGAVIIHEEQEAAVLLFIFALAENLENFVTAKSSETITDLLNQVPTHAQKLDDNGQIRRVDVSELAISDKILVAKGEQIPIDGLALNTSVVDEMVLTGESIPVNKAVGEQVFAGTINQGQALKIEVTTLSQDSVFSNIVRMVDLAQKRPSRLATKIERIKNSYVVLVLLAVPSFILILWLLQGMSFNNAFYRGMILLTVASPCALVASATPATLSSISKAARLGVLVKGGASLERLSRMTRLLSDKTGTLTQGKFQVKAYHLPEKYLAPVVYMVKHSSHPLSQTIAQHFSKVNLRTDFGEVTEIAGEGLCMGDLRVGRLGELTLYQDPSQLLQYMKTKDSAVLVADGQVIVGYFLLADELRAEAVEAVSHFKAQGVTVTMLTGDNEAVASSVAQALHITDYKAACFPADKLNYLTTSQNKGDIVGMIGDGINDAPTLANADIGIAMGSGAAVAIESADIVMMKNNLNHLYQVFQLSRKLNRIIIENLIFAIGVIVTLSIFNIFGILDLTEGVIFHEISTILVILNGLRLLR